MQKVNAKNTQITLSHTDIQNNSRIWKDVCVRASSYMCLRWSFTVNGEREIAKSNKQWFKRLSVYWNEDTQPWVYQETAKRNEININSSNGGYTRHQLATYDKRFNILFFFVVYFISFIFWPKKQRTALMICCFVFFFLIHIQNNCEYAFAFSGNFWCQACCSHAKERRKTTFHTALFHIVLLLLLLLLIHFNFFINNSAKQRKQKWTFFSPHRRMIVLTVDGFDCLSIDCTFFTAKNFIFWLNHSLGPFYALVIELNEFNIFRVHSIFQTNVFIVVVVVLNAQPARIHNSFMSQTNKRERLNIPTISNISTTITWPRCRTRHKFHLHSYIQLNWTSVWISKMNKKTAKKYIIENNLFKVPWNAR